KFVIHTVGPVWNNGLRNEEEKLKNCYLNSLNLANQYHIASIAFPNISTGIYKFPKKKAAEIAVSSVREIIEGNNSSVRRIQFVCFDDENYHIYLKTIKGLD
ncbi:macro domain-containing protein, partial [Paenibacillus aceris]